VKTILINLENVSDKVLNYKMKAIEVAKDTMLAQITHDLKTPINGMLALLEFSQ
jgi:hypothetical protein